MTTRPLVPQLGTPFDQLVTKVTKSKKANKEVKKIRKISCSEELLDLSEDYVLFS
jgi:hypothetical protein